MSLSPMGAIGTEPGEVTFFASKDKLKEFERMFAEPELVGERKFTVLAMSTKYPDTPIPQFKEIDADHKDVAAHKACQIPEGVVCEDTALYLGEKDEVGINIKEILQNPNWYVPHLGKTCVWATIIAQRIGDKVMLYKGEVHGIIVEPRGEKGFGFDKCVQPISSTKTLAEDKPDSVSARAKAVKAFVEKNAFKTLDAKPYFDWIGKRQNVD